MWLWLFIACNPGSEPVEPVPEDTGTPRVTEDTTSVPVETGVDATGDTGTVYTEPFDFSLDPLDPALPTPGATRFGVQTGVDLPLPGTAFSGMRIVFQSPYLMTIAAYLALMTFASTVLYFQQGYLVGEAFVDRAVRTAFYAKIDVAVNVLTIVLQMVLTATIWPLGSRTIHTPWLPLNCSYTPGSA